MTRLIMLIALTAAAGCAGPIDDVVDANTAKVGPPMVEITARFDVWDDFTLEDPATVCWDDGVAEYCADTFLGPPVTLTVPANRDGWLFVDTGIAIPDAAIPLRLYEVPADVDVRLDSRTDLEDAYAAANVEPNPDAGVLRVQVVGNAYLAHPHARLQLEIDDSVIDPFVVDELDREIRPPAAPPIDGLTDDVWPDYVGRDRPDAHYFVDLAPEDGPYTVGVRVYTPWQQHIVCEALGAVGVYADTITHLTVRCE